MAKRGELARYSPSKIADSLRAELVYVDTPAGDLFLESEAEIRRYKSMFEHLQAVAVGPNDSADLLTRVAETRD